MNSITVHFLFLFLTKSKGFYSPLNGYSLLLRDTNLFKCIFLTFLLQKQILGSDLHIQSQKEAILKNRPVPDDNCWTICCPLRMKKPKIITQAHLWYSETLINLSYMARTGVKMKNYYYWYGHKILFLLSANKAITWFTPIITTAGL